MQGDPKILVDNLTPVALEELENNPENHPEDESLPFSLDDELLDDFLPEISPEDADQAPPAAENPAPKQNTQPTPAGQNPANTPSAAPADDEESQPSQGQMRGSKTQPTRRDSASKPYHVLSTPLPKPEPLPRPDQKPRCIYITLDTCGDKQLDVRRLRRIHDILVSRPGRDQFAFRVRENGCFYEINFPNVTTGLTDTLIQKLRGLMGDQNIDITQQP